MARQAKNVLQVVLAAGIQLYLGPTDALQASRYDVAPVRWQTLPMTENPYPDRAPKIIISVNAGNKADGAFPKLAIPAGKLKTPTPKMALTKLKTRLEEDAVLLLLLLTTLPLLTVAR